jgi:hypothetical protein
MPIQACCWYRGVEPGGPVLRVAFGDEWADEAVAEKLAELAGWTPLLALGPLPALPRGRREGGLAGLLPLPPPRGAARSWPAG